MPSVTVGLRVCSPARPRHPASLPICVPSVERLPAALSRRLLAETTWQFGYGWRHKPPSGTFHPDRADPCRAHERGIYAASLKLSKRLLKRHECRARVPGRGLVYRDERFPTGARGANRSRTARSSPRGGGAKGREANVRPKEHKWAVRQYVRGECASKHEAQAPQRTCCRAQRHERKEQILTRGDPRAERRGEVSRGHSSVGGAHEQKGVPSEGPKNERAELNENLTGTLRGVRNGGARQLRSLPRTG